MLREQWWLIGLCVLLSAAAAVAYAETRPRDYQASAKLLLQQDNPSSQILGLGSPYVDPVRQAATDQQLATSGAVTSRVVRRLHLGPRRYSELGGTTASVNGDSNVLTIIATNHNPRIAARVANAYAIEYVAFRRSAAQK